MLSTFTNQSNQKDSNFSTKVNFESYHLIAEPTSRIKDIKQFQDLLFRLGFDVSRVDEKWKFTFIKAIKSEIETNLKL